jgi:tyrosyl-tRNA synthetase
MSYTEFSYQLVQGTDFLHLYEKLGCRLQMGGSDQWGNIVTGTELIRRKTGGEAYALTCPLITKADGTKFGKTESGNVWLDPEKTSPYHFYQFWLNVSDEDASKYIKIFTLIGKEETESLIKEHNISPHERILQKRLAEEVTVMVHSREELDSAIEASQILFGKGTTESLRKMSENTFLSVFEGVPSFDVRREILKAGISFSSLCTEQSQVFSSKGDLRRLVQGGGVSINKIRIEDPESIIRQENLINGKYLLIQKGKKNYFLIRAV